MRKEIFGFIGAVAAETPKIIIGMIHGKIMIKISRVLCNNEVASAAPMAPIKIMAGVPHKRVSIVVKVIVTSKWSMRAKIGVAKIRGSIVPTQWARHLVKTISVKLCLFPERINWSRLPSSRSIWKSLFRLRSPARRAPNHNIPGPICARILGSGPMAKGVMTTTAIKNNSPVSEEACGANNSLRSRQNSAFILFSPREVKIFPERFYGFLEYLGNYELQR